MAVSQTSSATLSRPMLTGELKNKVDQMREEHKTQRLKTAPLRLYPAGNDTKGRPFDDLRWSRFKNFAAPDMFTVLSEHVFPFLRSLAGDGRRAPPLRTT